MAGRKLKLVARGFTAASFNFTRPNWQFQHLCQITVSWNCPKIQLFSKNGHKNCHFIVQFQVKLGTKKKKNPVFPWNPAYGEFRPKNSCFWGLKPSHKKKIPTKSEILSLKPLWFQKKYQNEILKPLWFHENCPFFKMRLVNRPFWTCFIVLRNA